MATSTKLLFIIAILLLIYGYLCRYFDVYFFWDSKHFGWIILVIALLGFLIDVKKILLDQRKNVFVVRAFISIIILTLGIAAGSVILFKSSDSYSKAIENLKASEGLKNEVGNIKGFGLFPSGDILKIAGNSSGGSATITITVRGTKIYEDVELTLEKISPLEWNVTSANPINYH